MNNVAPSGTLRPLLSGLFAVNSFLPFSVKFSVAPGETENGPSCLLFSIDSPSIVTFAITPSAIVILSDEVPEIVIGLLLLIVNTLRDKSHLLLMYIHNHPDCSLR